MRLFLTGGTGFLGAHTLRAASAAGHTVVALRRHGSTPPIAVPSDIQWVEGSLDDFDDECLAACDAFIHLAAAGVNPQSATWENCFKINLADSLACWRQAVQAGIKSMIICGSCSEYGSAAETYDAIPENAPTCPTDPYGASKAAASAAAMALAAQENLQLLVVRAFHMYGEGEAPNRFWPQLVNAAKTGRDLPMSPGMQMRDFCPASLAAKQLIWALENAMPSAGTPEVLHLGSGHAQTLLAFAQETWVKFDARGKLLPGALSYRKGESMRYVPSLRAELPRNEL